MQVLTPSGYKPPFMLANGDEVCAFNSGAPIVNRVENIDVVDYTEWKRWWKHHDTLPPFDWYRINSAEKLLFREQSIWRNGSQVCHVRDLVLGDVIYDDEDHPFEIESIVCVEDKSRIWYRFEIDGDHSFITDRLSVHNASRFWVGGTGTWDSSDTTHWAATSGGAGGQSVPGASDTVTLDANSGGGTVTLNFGGTITIQSLAMGAFTGTFDNSVNNNNITVSANGNAFNGSGSGTRTYKLGTATYTLSGNAAVFTIATATNLTYTGNTGCTISFTGTGARTFLSASALSHGNLSIGAASGGGGLSFTGSTCTVNSLSITAPNYISSLASLTITTAVTIAGTSTSQILLASATIGGTVSFTLAGSSTFQWCAFFGISFSNSPVATNSFDIGGNSGITITSPSTGSSGGGVIGS